MKVTFALVLSLLLLSLTFNYAYAQEPVIMEQVPPNGKVKVQLSWPEVLPDQLYNVDIRFLDPDTNQPLDNVSIGYDVAVSQNDDTIELYTDQNTSTGAARFEVVFPEGGTGPAQVVIAVTSMTNGSNSVQMHEVVSFDVQVVPEFSTLAVMVMAFSIVAVLVLSRCKTSIKWALYV